MKALTIPGLFLLLGLAALGLSHAANTASPAAAKPAPAPTNTQKLAKATFAGGCFWCMEPPFDKLDGVVSTTSGYIGGTRKNPTYEEVSAGGTGHTEAVQILYDPAKVGYAQLLDVFWKNIDPVAENRQFCDVGSQYRSGIFFHDAEQKRLAEESRKKIQTKFRYGVVTEIVPAGPFWAAEEYHQDYYVKNPVRYKFYRNGCGRDRRLAELWGRE